MDGSYYGIGILFVDDDLRQPRFSLLIALSGDDWLKFKKAPVYQELMNWLKEAKIPCKALRRMEPETRRSEPAERRKNQRKHPILQWIAPVISSILTTLLTLKLLGVL